MRQDIAVQKVVESLKQEKGIRSLFLKGSMGRNEHDEHSDIDLYCLVDEDHEQSFLESRVEHLRAYKELLFYEDIFIIAPQIIAIYEDWLHIDLFTVTEKTIQAKDYFTVLYDRDGVMKKYLNTQTLTLTKEGFKDHLDDVAWFFFQYTKAQVKGNDLWATETLRHVMRNFVNLLLYRYAKDRSLLGLKTVQNDLPGVHREKVRDIYECITPSRHPEAALRIGLLIEQEYEWMVQDLVEGHQTSVLLSRVKDRVLAAR